MECGGEVPDWKLAAWRSGGVVEWRIDDLAEWKSEEMENW